MANMCMPNLISRTLNNGNFCSELYKTVIIAQLLSCIASVGASFEGLGAPLFLLGPI